MREQTFKIRQENWPNGITSEQLWSAILGSSAIVVGELTVTEITEPDKCVWTDEGAFVKVGCGREPICSCVTDFIRCPEEPINFCPYCGKPIEVRDGR